MNGRVPDSLKIAKVVPIHKKGKLSEFCNYRPVSVLPALSKIYERLVYNRILEFIDKHEIFSNDQFGFRKKYSTSHALNSLVNQFHDSVEKNEYMIGLFIDLSRAFDTISHKILINKLYKYGIRGIALEWIKDYLLNRKQYVVYHNAKSNMSSVEIGVPQGSILGPLLFLLYVNELPNISSTLSCIQFADDTSIFIRGRSLPEIASTLNHEMEKITDWLKDNMLTINVSKTNYMIMTAQGKRIDDQECNITVGGSILNRVSQTTFLGFVLDDKLTWKNHINHIYTKISKVIGILYKSKRLLCSKSLLTLYDGLIKPYFSYGITVWGNTFKTYTNKLDILHKKVVRIISFSDYKAHTGPLFRKFKIMTLAELCQYFTAIHIYKISHGLLPIVFMRDFTFSKSSRNPYNLRSQCHTKRICGTSMRNSAPKLWNILPNNIKNANSIYIFKRKMKKYFICS